MLPRYEAVLFGRVQAFVTTTEGLEMERLFRIANCYCLRINTYPTKAIFKNPFLYLSILLLIGFFYFMGECLRLPDGIPKKTSLATMLIFETTALLSFFKLIYDREKLIIKSCSEKFKRDFKTTTQIKKFLLGRYFKKHNGDYSQLVARINECMAQHKENSESIGKSKGNKGKLYFDPDSKTRVYTLIGVMLTLITTFALKSASDEDSFFSAVDYFFTTEGISLYFTIVIGLFMIMVFIVEAWTTAPILIKKLSVSLTRTREHNTYNLNILKHDLFLLSWLSLAPSNEKAKPSASKYSPLRPRPPAPAAQRGRRRTGAGDGPVARLKG